MNGLRIDPELLAASPTVVVGEQHRTPLVLTVVAPLEIGRDGAGLVLLDAEISRRHLLLQPLGGALLVSDLGSLNGSTVDGRPLGERHRLAAGEEVRFGGCTLALVAVDRASLRPRARPVAPDRELRETSIGLLADAVLNEGSTSVEPGDAGTITIVFSDIEGSTKRAVELGDVRWHEVLSVHNRIMRKMLVRHHGTETHSLGDGFMMCFHSARRAIGFITDAQRALAAYEAANPLEGLKVRAGVHTGEAVLGDGGDLFGRHVIMASRIADQAKGGEILVSSLVREIVEPRGDLVFGESRSVALKGLAGEHRVHRIVY